MKISDIARMANVSTATVSRVINNSGYVSEEKRQLINKIIKETNYQINLQAKALRISKSKMIACVVPALDSSLVMDINNHLLNILNDQGYTLIITKFTNRNSEKSIVNKVRELASKGIDGIILMTGITSDEVAQEIGTMNVPIVCLNSYFDQLYSVNSDVYQLAYQMAKHVIDQGYTKIAYCKCYGKASITTDFYQGIQAALIEHGLKTPDHWLVDCQPGKNHHDSGIITATYLSQLEDQPEVFISQFDRISIIAQKICQEKGAKIRFTGMGNLEIAEFVTPALTTADYDNQKLAQNLYQTLITLIDKETPAAKKVSVEGRLIKRESV